MSNNTTQSEYPKFVTVYAVTRQYGGPEEGGWWYNEYEPEDSIRVDGERAQATMVRQLEKTWLGETHGDIYSVRGGVEHYVLIEDVRHENKTTSEERYYS